MSVADYQRIMDAIQKLTERLDAIQKLTERLEEEIIARMKDRRDLDLAIDAIAELQPERKPARAAR